VKVDSFRFLPRSFRALYESAEPEPGEDGPVWTPVEKRLAEMRIALLTSAGLYEEGSQDPFDLDRERREPAWGDPTWRPLAATVLDPGRLGMAHLHVNSADILADPAVAFPLDPLRELTAAGVIGSVAAEHISVMGYQERDLHDWRSQTAPEIVARLRSQEVDGLILAPV
jgi:D-proline reductase (dithiol) PrdB